MKNFTLKLIFILFVIIVIFTFFIMRVSYKEHKSYEAEKIYNELKYKLKNTRENELNFAFFGDFSEKYSSCHKELTENQKQELLHLKDSLFNVFRQSTYKEKP